MLPMLANALGIPVRSSSYVPSLSVSASAKKSDQIKQAGYIQKLFFFSQQDSFEVDTGIRLFQYASLAWSVVDLVPSLFFHLGL
uniref:Sphingosine-1-phosphate phosphohydrolase n=2 Tax=Solanum TaxID=4107 RepID=M0ZKR2_SOLTU